jgi:hypothetical protein
VSVPEPVDEVASLSLLTSVVDPVVVVVVLAEAEVIDVWVSLPASVFSLLPLHPRPRPQIERERIVVRERWTCIKDPRGTISP